MRVNVPEVEWEAVTVMGIPMLFTDSRVDRTSVPEGIYMYEVRHSDDDWGEPTEIGTCVFVNYFGTLLSKGALPFDNNERGEFITIDPWEDWSYEGYACPFAEFFRAE